MTDQKKWGIKDCRKHGPGSTPCDHLKRNPKWPDSPERCTALCASEDDFDGSILPGTLPACIQDPDIDPKKILHSMMPPKIPGARDFSCCNRRSPVAKNCPATCPYKRIRTGEVFRVVDGKGVKKPGKIYSCAFSDLELQYMGCCHTTILDSEGLVQQQEIENIAAAIKRCQARLISSKQCSSTCCPDGMQRCTPNDTACPLIKVPFDDLKECPIFRIPAKVLPAPAESAPVQAEEKPAEKSSKARSRIEKPPSDIKKEQGKLQGNSPRPSIRACPDQCPYRLIVPEVKGKEKNYPQGRCAHPDVDGQPCNGELEPVWRHGRWLDICRTCGYREIPKGERLREIEQLAGAGTIRKPQEDTSRQSALFSFRGLPPDPATEARPVECRVKDLPKTLICTKSDGVDCSVHGTPCDGTNQRCNGHSLYDKEECQEPCDYRARCRYRYPTKDCKEIIGKELRRTKETPEWYAALTEAKRHNHPEWAWEVWKNVPGKGAWLYEGTGTYDEALALCDELTKELPKNSEVVFSMRGRPAPDYPANDEVGPCKTCKIECIDENGCDGCWEFEEHSEKLNPEPGPKVERWGYREICIISCGKAKIWDKPAKGKKKTSASIVARNAYTGPLFTLARDYAEHEFTGQEYYILSDKYGLIRPGDEIENYNVSPEDIEHDPEFLDMVQQRAKADPDLAMVKKITVLCGAIHQRIIEQAFRGVEIVNPVKGLPQGERMKRLKELIEPLQDPHTTDPSRSGGPTPGTCRTCGHHKGRKTFHPSCPRQGELMFKGGDKSAKTLMEETQRERCPHWFNRKDRCQEISEAGNCIIGGSCTRKTAAERLAFGCIEPVETPTPAKKPRKSPKKKQEESP